MVYDLVSLTLRIEHTLRMSENRVLRRIFGLRREDVVGGWRQLQNEELHTLNASPNFFYGDQVKEDEMRGACITHEMRNTHKIFVRKSEGK